MTGPWENADELEEAKTSTYIADLVRSWGLRGGGAAYWVT
jgi:hypothetical protein